MQVTTTEVQNNFGKYLKLCKYEDIIIIRNGKKIARLTTYTDNIDTYFIREAAEKFAYSGKKISYEEFLEITQNSELRYEYIDGEIYLLASPFYEHQKAIRQIFIEFVIWFKDKNCEPLTSPFDVTLFKKNSNEDINENIQDANNEDEADTKEDKKNINIVQPDILVICDKENIDENGKYHGTPSLVVEVLSKSTKKKDLAKKLDLYSSSGIKEYWVVNTFSKEVYIYAFKDLNIEKMIAFKDGDRVESVIFSGLGINVNQVFA